MLKFGIAIATVLVVVVIVYGSIQAQEEFSDGDGGAMATSTPVAILQPTATPVTVATTTDPVVLPGSGFTIQVRGGDNPCRYLYTSNRVGTFAGGEIVLGFVAGTYDADLAATGEMHLYGATGPHLFEIEDAGGTVILTVPVDRGATVHETVVFPGVGLYTLYDRLYEYPGYVSEIFARPIGDPGYVPQTGWCPPEESAP